MIGKRTTIFLTIVVIAAVGFAIGRASGDSVSVPERVKKVFPSLPPPPKDSDGLNGADGSQADVLIEIPAEGAEVGGFFDVAGRFRNDGRSLKVILKNSDGQTLSETDIKTLSTTDGEYGRFQATLILPVTARNRVVVEIMSQMPDGSLSGPDAVRVVELKGIESFEVKVYFSNNQLDPAFSCTQTYPVERTVQAEGRPYQAALESLLAGPTKIEKSRGYITGIPANTELISVLVNNRGQATVDFSRELDQGVAGSCLVSTIRSQIMTTLGQFSEIKEVTISVEGDTEESLQP